MAKTTKIRSKFVLSILWTNNVWRRNQNAPVTPAKMSTRIPPWMRKSRGSFCRTAFLPRLYPFVPFPTPLPGPMSQKTKRNAKDVPQKTSMIGIANGLFLRATMRSIIARIEMGRPMSVPFLVKNEEPELRSCSDPWCETGSCSTSGTSQSEQRRMCGRYSASQCGQNIDRLRL